MDKNCKDSKNDKVKQEQCADDNCQQEKVTSKQSKSEQCKQGC